MPAIKQEKEGELFVPVCASTYAHIHVFISLSMCSCAKKRENQEVNQEAFLYLKHDEVV